MPKRPQKFEAKPLAPIVNIAQARSKRAALHPNRKPGIFLAVPSVTGKVHGSIAIAFANVMQSTMLEDCPFRFAVHIEVGKRGPDYARNCIVKTFMQETDFDWLVMVDDDQGMPHNFWQLCMVLDADVVSGLTYCWVANMDPEAMLRVNNYGIDRQDQCFNLLPPPAEVKAPYRVPIVGTGCIAIRRRVFAPKPAGLGLSPFYFTHREDRRVMGGEDINFSVECNRAGFTLAVHPGVWFDHSKELPLSQIAMYYDARHKMEMEGKQTTEQQRVSIG